MRQLFQEYDGCNENFNVQHTLSCKKERLLRLVRREAVGVDGVLSRELELFKKRLAHSLVVKIGKPCNTIFLGALGELLFQFETCFIPFNTRSP